MPRAVHSWARSEAGAIAPITALSLIALVAVGGLAYDVSRGFALRAELESAVDSAALAGATQLDGQPGAQDRARSAITSALAQNSQLLADTPQAAVAIVPGDIKFLNAARALETHDAQITLVQIDLTPRNLGLLFGAFAGLTNFNVTAHAIAGYASGLCKAPPILICNPDEAGGLTFNGDAHIGQGIVLQEGGAQTWGPGNFGFLQVNSLNKTSGIPAVQDALARADPQVECIGNTVTTTTVSVPQAGQYLNVRFDRFGSATIGLNGEANYQPALNTIAGDLSTSANSCAPSPLPSGTSYAGSRTPTPAAMALPMDAAHYASTCPIGTGDGNWDRDTYFDVNHGPNSYSTTYSSVPWSYYGPNPASGTGPTRYQVYQWELANLNSGVDVWSNGQGGPPSSSVARDWARPICYSGVPSQAAPDRRTISAVVVDCQAQSVTLGSNADVVAYVDLFLTEPVSNNSCGVRTIRGEILGASTNASPAGKSTRLYSVRLYE